MRRVARHPFGRKIKDRHVFSYWLNGTAVGVSFFASAISCFQSSRVFSMPFRLNVGLFMTMPPFPSAVGPPVGAVVFGTGGKAGIFNEPGSIPARNPASKLANESAGI